MTPTTTTATPWARPRWVPVPPLWRVWRDGEPTRYVGSTWNALAEKVERLLDPARAGTEDELPDTAVIVRDPDPAGWALRCATSSCPRRGGTAQRSEFVGGAFIGLYLSREDFADIALRDGWTRHHGGFWRCPACAVRAR